MFTRKFFKVFSIVLAIIVLVSVALIGFGFMTNPIQAQEVIQYTGNEKGTAKLIYSPVDANGHVTYYLWMSQETSNRLFANNSKGLLKWEADPGSGYSDPVFVKVEDPQELQTVREYINDIYDRGATKYIKFLLPFPSSSDLIWKSDLSQV